MTRWARSKSALKHTRQPQEATSWNEFVAQRQAAPRPGDRQEANQLTEKDSKHTSLTVQGQRGIHRSLKGSELLLHRSLDGGPKKRSATSVATKEGRKTRSDADDSRICGAERKAVATARKQKKSKKTEGILGGKETASGLVQAAKVNTEVRNKHRGAKKSDRSRTAIGASTGVKDNVENEMPSKRKNAKRDAAKEAGVRKAKVARASKESAKATAKKLPKQTKRSVSGSWQVTQLCKTQRDIKAYKGAETAKATKPKAEKKWLKRLREERESKGIALLPAKVENRIYAMKKAMRRRGASGEEVKAEVRRLRRKEELLFRRQLRKLCFRCRQPGHAVSDCPLVMADVNEAMGVCFKCGSTEHFSSKCTVQTGTNNEFPYARCFICKQEGHISRKCPRNKRGIYPKGGHCNFCGAVDHFKANCPKMQKNKKKEDDEEVTGEVMDVLGSADAEPAPLGFSGGPTSSKVVSF